MTSPRPLCVGLSLAVTWLMGNAWRRADSQVESIFDTDFYVGLAQRAEAAKLDFLFRPDALFIDPQGLTHAPGFSSLDPTVLLAALARETSRIGLVTTAATTFNPPYVVARQIQSLDWVTRGRAGWNVVTALDGSQNFGSAPMPSSEQRYRKAQEFVDVVRALWHSYPQQALRLDRAAGVYADSSQVRPIDHDGEFFCVSGPLNLPSRGQARIPLFQAGASEWGRAFAAGMADAVFAATPDIGSGVELRRDLRHRAQALGRPAEAIRVLPGLSLFLAPTAAQAKALHAETQAPQDEARRHAYVRQMLGIDLSALDPAQPLTPDMLPAAHDVQGRGRTHAELMRRLIARERPAIADFMRRPEVAGSAHWLVVGTVEDALAEIRTRVEAGAADGFIALPGGARQSLDLLFDELMPRLSEAGLFRRDYTGSTLGEHLGIES